MNDVEILNSSTAGDAATVSVTLETAKDEVQVISLAPTTAYDLNEYLAGSIPTAMGVAAVLESWAASCEHWERTELAASHKRLYSILAQCYEFYLTMKSESTAKGVRKQLANGLDAFVAQRGLRTLTKTHDMNKVVKAVFGEDRRRVSAYAMALRAALVSGREVNAKTDHVPATELASWLTSKGGVEEVRLGSKHQGMTPVERAGAAEASIEYSEPLLTIKPDAKSMPFGADDVDKKVVLLVTYRPTGELEVHAVVKSGSAVRAALAAHYAAHKEKIGDAKVVAGLSRPTAVAQALAG